MDMLRRSKASARAGSYNRAVFVVIFAFVATAVILITKAATPVASIEPELGNQTTNTTIQSDTRASAGQAVRFVGGQTALLPLGYGQTNGPSGTWNLKLNDEFDGTTLNATNWSTGWFGTGITSPVQDQETACYDPAQVTVGGGNLKLAAIASTVNCAKGINPHPYRSGAITSNKKKLYSYGYFESRMLLDTSSSGHIYNWPAWWMDGTGDWPATGELDIMEGLSGTANATWHGPESAGAGRNFADVAITPGWHTFAAEWEPGKVTAYYDGVRRGSYSSTTNITSDVQFLALMLQIDEIGGHGGDLKVPTEMLVDYVRVWQR